MIPILYERDETLFVSNGLGRLRDCISCVVTEERNGIFECDFEYPIDGAKYDLIQLGRIIAVTHDNSGTIEPFDIVGMTKPINGIVSFHAVHISYRLCACTVTGRNINSLSAAFALLRNATPSNPFTFETDKQSTGYMAAADGLPHSVRQLLGGIEGSILDAYGGEYKFERFTVSLLEARGTKKPFSIRYGVNMLEYNDEIDASGTFTSCVPFWESGDVKVVGNKVSSPGTSFDGRERCIPLDLSDKFEEPPTRASLQSFALAEMTRRQTWIPTQSISIDFIDIGDLAEYSQFESLYNCGLCDLITVVFPDYGTSGTFKIVKTEWNALKDRYDNLELGSLSTTLGDLFSDIGSSSKSASVTEAYAEATTLSAAVPLTTENTLLNLTTLQKGKNCRLVNGAIVVDVPGTYAVSGWITTGSGFTVNDIQHARLAFNGTFYGQTVRRAYSGTPYDTINISTKIAKLNAGDRVQIAAYNQTGARGTVGQNCGLTVIKIGEYE